VFVLFDTSDCMYRSLAALYTFSSNLATSVLSKDRTEVLSGLRMSVAGAETRLYNALFAYAAGCRQGFGSGLRISVVSAKDSERCLARRTPTRDFREISVELLNDPGKKLRVRARPGCRRVTYSTDQKVDCALRSA
jgi:hypothetical protein